MQPIFNVFKLKVAENHVEEFFQIGQTNFNQSITKEEGTLAMYLTKVDDQQTFCVIEVYRDAMAYQAHITSSHFKDFATFAQDYIPYKERVELIPQILYEQEQPVQEEDLSSLFVRLISVRVKESRETAFKDELFDVVNQAKDTKILYAGFVADSPNTWYIIDISSTENSIVAAFLEQNASIEQQVKQNFSLLECVNKGNLRYRAVTEKEAKCH
ncbi:putative quinol monooxygenase [Streptococcus marmotae]|uniref:putative quinol monooxygenase n=1 Tax=Streptococcus marmotae TaxID=1825069 RepID=UPI000835E2EB|nr:antibiotic biosynthesis monooxygenase [Streptococcus marmotae]